MAWKKTSLTKVHLDIVVLTEVVMFEEVEFEDKIVKRVALRPLPIHA